PEEVTTSLWPSGVCASPCSRTSVRGSARNRNRFALTPAPTSTSGRSTGSGSPLRRATSGLLLLGLALLAALADLLRLARRRQAELFGLLPGRRFQLLGDRFRRQLGDVGGARPAEPAGGALQRLRGPAAVAALAAARQPAGGAAG